MENPRRDFSLKFWRGRNSAIEGGLLTDIFLSSKEYARLRAARRAARDARKAAAIATEIEGKVTVSCAANHDDSEIDGESDDHDSQGENRDWIQGQD